MTEDTFRVVGSAFVEAVHIELSDERVHFGVSEVAGEDDGLELVDVLDDELRARWSPVCYFGKFLILDDKIGTLSISKVLAMKPAI